MRLVVYGVPVEAIKRSNLATAEKKQAGKGEVERTLGGLYLPRHPAIAACRFSTINASGVSVKLARRNHVETLHVVAPNSVARHNSRQGEGC